MIITRHGKGCFKIQAGGGVSIVIDPLDSRLKPDITLKTKTELPLNEEQSDRWTAIGPGEYDTKGVKVYGFQVAGKDDKNIFTAYRIEADDMFLVFLGNPGIAFAAPMAEQLGAVDILFVPKGSSSFVKQVSPLIVVPTYFSDLASAKKEFGADTAGEEKLVIKKKDLPQKIKKVFLK